MAMIDPVLVALKTCTDGNFSCRKLDPKYVPTLDEQIGSARERQIECDRNEAIRRNSMRNAKRSSI